MMPYYFHKAVIAGVERVTAWSILLDRINVFPVADGDTGRNLVITLAPLHRFKADLEDAGQELLFSARGNSGNIAARFFQAFLKADHPDTLPDAIRRGRDEARLAVFNPQPGTMLTFFEALAEAIPQPPADSEEVWVQAVLERLVQTVMETTAQQACLQRAGVVDSGALGMLLFFDGFLNALVGRHDGLCNITEIFADRLEVRNALAGVSESGYCIDAVLTRREGLEKEMASLAGLGESMVVVRSGDYVKVHLHTLNAKSTRRSIEKFGNVLRWSEDDLDAQISAFRNPKRKQAIHIMTDAAGSLMRDHARLLGITLLDSFINLGETSLPESCVTPELLYGAMKKGVSVSTAQASIEERTQSYEGVQSLYGKILYLCVGSYFTGNYDAAVRWKADQDPDNALTVIDTGCAGGRLGLLAAKVAEYAQGTDDPDAVIAFAVRAVDRCQEYIFIDKLQYLAAGGRMSKTGAFFGDMVRMKPVVSPQPDGVKRVGIVRNRRDQIAFALKRLAEFLRPDSRTDIWLEYTDNKDWLRTAVLPEIQKGYPLAKILVKPFSLTTGAHAGPGSWGLSFYIRSEE